jgi:hypothetical protein
MGTRILHGVDRTIRMEYGDLAIANPEDLGASLRDLFDFGDANECCHRALALSCLVAACLPDLSDLVNIQPRR